MTKRTHRFADQLVCGGRGRRGRRWRGWGVMSLKAGRKSTHKSVPVAQQSVTRVGRQSVFGRIASFFFFFFSLGFGSLLFPRGKATKESAKETKIDSNTTKHKQSHTRGRMRWKVAVFEVVGGFLLANTRWFAQRGLNSFKARAAVEGHALGFRRIPAYSSAVAMFKRSRVALSQHFSLPS